MKKMLILILVLGFTAYVNAYTNEDWRVYKACKERVYDNKKNSYAYEACKEMLSHKKALRKYGASSSYDYWIKRLDK